MPFTSPFLREAASYLPPGDRKELEDAFELAKLLYGENRHVTGEPLLVAAEKVTRLLLHLHPDVRTLVACLLQFARAKHDLLGIERRFGKRIVRTIAALAVLERGSGNAVSSSGSLRKMLEALSEDIRVLLICLHNRLSLLEQAQTLGLKQRRATAREALDVFAPISARLGVYSLKYALETLAFAILYPEEVAEIEQHLKDLRRQQGPFIAESARVLKRLLAREGRRVEVIGREKHPYSIFRKMQRKSLSKITDLHDLFGLRVIVDSTEDCYQVLGLIHRTYRPVMHHMKDYIAFPKPNGYNSLHTTVLGLHVRDASLPFEIQIRTHDMEEEAEFGIAAHWEYKEGWRGEPLKQKQWKERMQSIRDLFRKGRGGTEEGTSLSEALSDRIYVLTPKGDPIELPKGATPLDFAFRVHTDIGLCFRAARVNGVIAPLNQSLENGDMVEILKWNEPRPSEHWLQLVATQEARSKLRAYFRRTRSASFLPSQETRATEQRTWRNVRVLPQPSSLPPLPDTRVKLEADTALPHRFAQCCAPHRGEPGRTTGAGLPPIIGFITRNGTINIHKRSCRMLADANPERFVQAHWNPAHLTPGMSVLRDRK